jgi:hypothetical protein
VRQLRETTAETPLAATEREVIAIEVARRMFPTRTGSETSDVLLGLLRSRHQHWIKNTLAVADYILLREAREPK